MTHQHRTPRGCATCEAWPGWARHLAAGLSYINGRIDHLDDQLTRQNTTLRTLNRKADTMTSNQDHLNQDVTAIGTAIATAVAELKAQIAAGATPEALDFTALDALAASTQAEADADAPPVPPVA